jgi:predicted phosphodiesterase
MSVYVCGDTHGNNDYQKISLWKPEDAEHKYLIQLGDWGGLWSTKNDKQGYKKDKEHLTKWMKKSIKNNFTLLIVPGNHENWDLIDELPEEEMFGSIVKYLDVYHNFHQTYMGKIYILKRGHVYNIENKSFFVFGGAVSIDKDYRTLGIDYWEHELATYEEYEKGFEELEKVNNTVDYVLTHTCPLNVMSDIIHKTVYTEGKYSDPTSKYLMEIYKQINFKEWHFGHFHTDVKNDYSETGDGIFQCHYINLPYKLY